MESLGSPLTKSFTYATGMTDQYGTGVPSLDMVISEVPNIVAAERLNDSIVIKFDNGQCGLYPSAFLYSKLSECEQLDESKVDW